MFHMRDKESLIRTVLYTAALLCMVGCLVSAGLTLKDLSTGHHHVATVVATRQQGNRIVPTFSFENKNGENTVDERSERILKPLLGGWSNC